MKKLVFVILTFVICISLTACSDNSSSSYSGYSDLGMSCGVSGCYHDAVSGEMFCQKHIDEMNGVVDLCKYNGCTMEAYSDGYCATHKVTNSNDGYKTCIEDGCMERAEEDSIHCYFHGYH